MARFGFVCFILFYQSKHQLHRVQLLMGHTPQKLRCASEMAAGAALLCGLLRGALLQRGESWLISTHLLCTVFR